MSREEQQHKSLAAKAAWPLLVLTAVLQAFIGLSAVAYMFMGVPNQATGLGGWIAAALGALQSAAAVVALVLAVRHDLRGATLAVAAGVVLGWLSTLPSIAQFGLFQRGDKVSPFYFAISSLLAIAGATLAWRRVYPIAAALLVSAMTIFGILVVIAFAMIIAIHGF